MLQRKGNAVLLVRLAFVGAGILAMCAPMAFVHLPPLPARTGGLSNVIWVLGLRFVVLMSPVVIGAGLMVWAERRFKRGFLDDLWTEDELARVQRLVDRKVWTVIAGLAFAMWCAVIFGLHTLRGCGLAYVLLVPSQTAQRIGKLIRPRQPQAGGLVGWRNFQPIRSEHWGESGTQL